VWLGLRSSSCSVGCVIREIDPYYGRQAASDDAAPPARKEIRECTPEQTEALLEVLGRRVYEPVRATCLQQIMAHELGIGPINVDEWRRRLVENERLRERYIRDYAPLTYQP
jgi:hypothetical protein